MAGFETSSSNLCFILYELCLHQDIQSQLRDEIKKELDKHGNLTYECIQKMKYLNMVCLGIHFYFSQFIVFHSFFFRIF